MKKTRYGAIGLLAICSIALVGTGANAGDNGSGYFKVKATDESNPEITATAGLDGVAPGGEGTVPGGETTPGGEVDLGDPTVVNTLTCGDLSFNVTQGMLDHSEKNEEILANGGDPIPYPQGGWLFASKVVTPNESTIAEQLGGFSEADLKSMGIGSINLASYVFSDTPNFNISAHPFDDPLYNQATLVTKNSPETSFDTPRSGFASNDGTTPALISNAQVLQADGTGFPGGMGCQVVYLKDNLLHKNGGAAFYSEDAVFGYDTSAEVWATDGIVYKEGSPAVTTTYNGETNLQVSYSKPNGEEYIYNQPYNSKMTRVPALSHISKVVTLNESETANYKVCSEVVDCDKNDPLEDPVGRERVTKETGIRTTTGVGDLAGEPLTTTFWDRNYENNEEGWAVGSVRIVDDTGTRVSEAYKNADLKLSNLNGPACVERGKDGQVFSNSYFIDGEEFFNQADYEAAGGKNWQGRTINGLNDEGNPLVGISFCQL